jgi:hypothetical protein
MAQPTLNSCVSSSNSMEHSAIELYRELLSESSRPACIGQVRFFQSLLELTHLNTKQYILNTKIGTHFALQPVIVPINQIFVKRIIPRYSASVSPIISSRPSISLAPSPADASSVESSSDFFEVFSAF